MDFNMDTLLHSSSRTKPETDDEPFLNGDGTWSTEKIFGALNLALQNVDVEAFFECTALGNVTDIVKCIQPIESDFPFIGGAVTKDRHQRLGAIASSHPHGLNFMRFRLNPLIVELWRVYSSVIAADFKEDFKTEISPDIKQETLGILLFVVHRGNVELFLAFEEAYLNEFAKTAAEHASLGGAGLCARCSMGSIADAGGSSIQVCSAFSQTFHQTPPAYQVPQCLPHLYRVPQRQPLANQEWKFTPLPAYQVPQCLPHLYQVPQRQALANQEWQFKPPPAYPVPQYLPQPYQVPQIQPPPANHDWQFKPPPSYESYLRHRKTE